MKISSFLSQFIFAFGAMSSQASPNQQTSVFDAAAFDQKMAIHPPTTLEAAPSFFRTVADEAQGKSEIDFATTYYNCRDGFQVILIPMIHIAEKSFYDHSDSVASAADVLLYEGLRPEYFFGPPFERDPRVNTPQDFESLTTRRLLTLRKVIVAFHRITNRNPRTFLEISNAMPLRIPEDAIVRYNRDSWGRPFSILLHPDGSVTLSSLGADGVSSADDLFLTVPAQIPDSMEGLPEIPAIEAYNKLGAQANLALQSAYDMKSIRKSTSVNADISLDMLIGDIPQTEKIANNGFRNLIAIQKTEQIFSSSTGKPQTVAIMYGALHMVKFDQYLTGARLACKIRDQVWVRAISVDKNRPGVSPELNLIRKSLIKSFSEVKPVFNPDPLGLGAPK